MTAKLHVLGIDPGPVPGFASLHYWNGSLTSINVLQCSWPIADQVLPALLQGTGEWQTIVQLERFVVGRGSGKSARAGAVTRDLIGRLDQIAAQHGAVVTQQNASRVKHWATDHRLNRTASGGKSLLEHTVGMRHARDAARHALFAAVLDGRITDPLSKTQTRATTTQGAHA